MRNKLQIIVLLFIFIGIHTPPVVAVSDIFSNTESLRGTWYAKGSSAGRIGNSTVGNLDNSRTTYGLKGNINNDIGVKWRQFLGGVNIDSSLVYGGADINGDGNHDFFYVKGGKGYLIDGTTGLMIWDTKVYGINKILGVEGVLGINKSKQIVFVFGDNPFYVGILNGRTGEMITNSKLWGTLTDSWTYSPDFIRDKQTDGSVIYTISKWRSPLVGIKIYAEKTQAKVEPLYENRYKNSAGSVLNTSTDDYSGLIKKMTLGGKPYFLISDQGTAYIMDASTKNPSSAGGDFSMANYHTFSITPGRSHGYNNSLYDFNSDGDDEFIMWNNEVGAYFQKTKLWVGGSHSGQIKNYWGISWPLGTTINKVIPVKNYSNPQESYIAVRLNGSTKYQFYSAFGSGTFGYTPNVNLGSNTSTILESFNENIAFEYDINTYGDILGIFDNGIGDHYVVTRNSINIYNFFRVVGSETFQNPAEIQITGTHYNLQDKNLSYYALKYGSWEMQGGDINADKKREFSVVEGSYIKHYEIINNTKTLISEIEFQSSENSQFSSTTRQYTYNGKDIWTSRYNSIDNTLKLYKTNTTGGQMNFTHLTQNFSIYSVGQTSPISIFKNNNKNYLHFGNAVYDSSTASPNTPPTKIINIGNDGHFIDVNGDGNTDLIESGKMYNLNSSFGKTLQSNNYGTIGDFNGDGTLDRVHTYKDVDDYFKYYPVSGVDGTQLFSTISTSHTSCGPSSYHSIRLTDPIKDDLISFSSWCGHKSRIVMPGSGTLYELNHMHTAQMFDIDGDGIKDLFGQDYNYGRYHLQTTKLTASTASTIFNTPIYTWMQGDIGGPMASINRTESGILNFAVKGLRGEIIGLNAGGQILFRSHYYDGEKYPGGELSIFENGGVPLDFADAIVADITGNGKNEIIAGGMDGWIYILDINTGDIIYKYNIGVSIKHMSLGDSDNDGFLNILVSAQDGYTYRLTSSVMTGPSWIKDGDIYDFDIEMTSDDTKASANFSPVPGAQGYFVQLYNQTKKSPVFDWINVGNINNVCIKSANVNDNTCISAGIVFNLTNQSVYEWRVRSYNTLVSSPISQSNGFIVTVDKAYYLSEEYDGEVDTNISKAESSYMDKKLKVYGSNLGIIINTDNTPIRNIPKIDLVLTEKEYKIVLNNTKTIQGSGNTLSQVIPNHNCKNILASGGSKGNGIYIVNPSGSESFEVYCDMINDGGGWILVAVSNTSKNTFGKNNNRASPFIDFYQNEKENILNLALDDSIKGEVLKYQRRKDLISNSSQTLIKGIKGTDEYHIVNGPLNLGNRLMTNSERAYGKYYWNAQSSVYVFNSIWKTSLQLWGNDCGWTESISDLKINNLVTAHKESYIYDTCLGVSPGEPIGIGWFIR